MEASQKTCQLQIRVSTLQKDQIKQQADRARMSMSEWVLSQVLPSPQVTFQALAEELAVATKPSFTFAVLLEFLDSLDAEEYRVAVAEAPRANLDAYWENYVAATVEHAAAAKGSSTPLWTREVIPLESPAFGSTLQSLRLHLLKNSPPAFAARNIFIDSSVGDRV
jgi:hypothetical protein